MLKKLATSLIIGTSVASCYSVATELTGYRGEVVYFTDDPSVNSDALHHYSDGIVYIKDGHILDSGDFNKLSRLYPNAKVVDYRGRIITPGFVDTHIHYPQTEMVGSYGAQLLDWLKTYTFPTEEKFADKKYADKVAKQFTSLLIDHGTTTALVFATVHPSSVDALFEQAQKYNMRLISGKVLMDRNAPDALLDTPESAYNDSKALIEKWHGKGRLSYAVTPRFAPTSTDEELEVAGRLLKEYPTVYLHTHLAENKQEVAWVHDLFPKDRSYLSVYERHGLMTSRAIFAHSIHLDDQDYNALQQHHSAVAFCPSSNLFLGSGLFDLDEAQRHQIRVGLGTDIGAGTSFSQLTTMNNAYKVTQLRKAYAANPDQVTALSPQKSFYLATLGGAKALSLDDKIGSFTQGKEADFIVLNPKASPTLAQRIDHTTSLDDKLFAIEILGDDRTVEHTYIMGKQFK